MKRYEIWNFQVKIEKFQPLTYFGFMHLIATNLSLWLCTLIREISEVLLSYERRQLTASETSSMTTAGFPRNEALTTAPYSDKHRRSATNNQQMATNSSSTYTGPLLHSICLILIACLQWVAYPDWISVSGEKSYRHRYAQCRPTIPPICCATICLFHENLYHYELLAYCINHFSNLTNSPCIYTRIEWSLKPNKTDVKLRKLPCQC
jgi:Otopetrin